LQAEDTAKFKVCDTQCMYKALGYLALIMVWTPLMWPDIFEAPSYPCPQILSQLIPHELRPKKY